MVKLKQIEISERNLEDILTTDLEIIEEGLKLIGRQIRTDSGRIDILAVDEDKRPVIIELKTGVDEGQLDQGLRYYDWVNINIEKLFFKYSKKVDLESEPRLILVAPKFHKNLKRITKFINIPLDLIEYEAFKLPGGKKALHCKNIGIDKPKYITLRPTIDDCLNYIENSKVRNLCKNIVKEIKKNGDRIDPLQDNWLSIYRGRLYMYLGCKKHFFMTMVKMNDGEWTDRKRIKTKKDWVKVLNEEIKPIRKYLDENQD